MLPLWIAFLIAIALVGVGVWIYRRYFRKVSGREDRYTPERIVSPEQVAMLDYLHDTFPDQVVLPNVALKEMLSVRRSSDLRRAKERLSSQKVDFVVCDKEGRAVFAFDVEQYHLSDAKAKTHQVKIKNRILKTAGIRFLFLKNSIHRMPSPDDIHRTTRAAKEAGLFSILYNEEFPAGSADAQLTDWNQFIPILESHHGNE